MREYVYEYLKMLFKKCKIVNDGMRFRIVKGKDVICSLSIKNAKLHGILFSHSEFYFIKNMFGISEGETVDYITEYLSNNYSMNLSYLPFYPYL